MLLALLLMTEILELTVQSELCWGLGQVDI